MRFLFQTMAALLAALASLALSPMSAVAAEKTQFRVLLDWFINPDHAPLIVAYQRGYYAQAGLDVALIEPADPNDPPLLLAAKQGDVALSYQPQLYLMRQQDLPLRAVGVIVGQPLNSLVVLDLEGAKGDITQISQLKGKTIGYSVGGFETAVLGKMLENDGLSMDDVQLVNINFALTPALISGQVAAVIGAFRNFELNQLALEGAKGRAFLPEEQGVPSYDELIILAHQDQLERGQLLAFMQATQRAAQELAQDPEAAWADFVAYRSSLDDELNRRAWQDTVPLLAKDVFALDAQRYQDFGAFALERGLINAVLPTQDYLHALKQAE